MFVFFSTLSFLEELLPLGEFKKKINLVNNIPYFERIYMSAASKLIQNRKMAGVLHNCLNTFVNIAKIYKYVQYRYILEEIDHPEKGLPKE